MSPSAVQKPSVSDELREHAPLAEEARSEAPSPPRPEAPRQSALLRALTLLRPEEYLLLAIGGIFAYLHYAEITTVVFKTSFIRAGWQLFIGFIQVFTVVAAWRAYRQAVGRAPVPSNAVIGAVVLGPIVVVGLFTAGLLKNVKWEPDYLDKGWYGVAAIVLASFVWTARSVAKEERRAKLAGAAKSMALDVFGFARDWLPFIALLSTYENALRLVGRVRSTLYDPEMYRLDEIIFGGHLDVWFQRITSARLTEVFAFFYNGLYLFPILVGMTLYLQWRHREFRAFLLSFVVAGWVGYLGYLLVPVIGPKYFFPELYTVPLHASNVTASLRDSAMQAASEAGMRFLAIAEQISDRSAYGGQYPRNCFPSLHTAWGVVVLICSYRYTRPLFYILAIPLLWMIAATSYLRFHYMVDVLAGVLLAVLMVAAMPRIDAAWERLAAKARNLPPPPSIVAPVRTVWDKVRYYFALSAFFVFTAFVAVYSFRSDLAREKRALAEALIAQEALPDLPPAGQVNARFGDTIELVGVRAVEDRFSPDKVANVELYWRALERTEGNWKIFVHVRDVRGRNLTNADHHPVGGAYRIRNWKPGDVVKDTITFRVPKVPRGSAIEIWVGIFDELQVEKRMPVTVRPERHPVQRDAVRVLTTRLQ